MVPLAESQMVDDGNSLDQKLNMSYASVQDDSTIIHIIPSAAVHQPGRCARAAQVGISSVATTASFPGCVLLQSSSLSAYMLQLRCGCEHSHHYHVGLFGKSTPGAVLLAAVESCTTAC